MNSFPPVSAMCLTYGRPHLLEEAIESFLRQDYPGPKELVVLNDFAEQTLVYEHAEVRIVNVTERFPTVGEKRNACAALASHDLLFVWDDDDIHLPWRMSLSVRRLEKSKGYYKCPRAWMLNSGQLEGPKTNMYHGAACFTRELFERAGRYQHIGSGQDWELEVEFRKLISTKKDDNTLRPGELYYIYRWAGTGSYHLSAFGRDEGKTITGNQRVAEFVGHQVKAGKIKTGTVRLSPAWRQDYLDLLRSRIVSQANQHEPESMCQSLTEPVAPGEVHEVAAEATSSPPDLSIRVKERRQEEEPQTSLLPLISCIMPTYGRADYVHESLAMFLAQDYGNKELLIVNDCSGQVFQGEFPQVRIINCPQRFPSLGQKRNFAISEAAGDWIAIWDDDDVYFPWRLSFSMQEILNFRTPLYRPAEYWAYWGNPCLHENRCVPNWISHPLTIFHRDLWDAAGQYPHTTLCEDAGLFEKIHRLLRIDWLAYPIEKRDRFMIMRAASTYHHTSIQGGKHPPNTTPGIVSLSPRPIQDAILRETSETLIRKRERDGDQSQTAPAHSNGSVPKDWLESVRTRSYLDDLPAVSQSVGFGSLGRHGRLGYEEKQIVVQGERFWHALSTHPPATLTFALDGGYSRFESHVAINDDMIGKATRADFYVLADGEVVACATEILPGEVPRRIATRVDRAETLELQVRTDRWDDCHAVWLEPTLWLMGANEPDETITDCLGRARICVPEVAQSDADLCIALVVSHGYEEWLESFLTSLSMNGECGEARIAVFCFGCSPEIERIIASFNAVRIECEGLAKVDMASKSVLYSVGKVIRARKYLCFDIDMLVLGSLRSVVAALDVFPASSILVCRDAANIPTLGKALTDLYASDAKAFEGMAGRSASALLDDPLVVNDGFFAATLPAINAVDEMIRSFPGVIGWIEEKPSAPWRNQFVFNLALAKLRTAVEIDESMNWQLNHRELEWDAEKCTVRTSCHGNSPKVLHFNGAGRHKHPSLPQRFRSTKDPSRLRHVPLSQEVSGREEPVTKNNLRPRFVICSSHRAGSHMLATALKDHPDLAVAGEVLRRPELFGLANARRRPIDEASVIDEALRRFNGCIVHRQHVRAMEHLPSVDGLKVIFLTRRNWLAQLVSEIHALQTNVWHVASHGADYLSDNGTSKPLVPPQRVTVPPERCFAYLREQARLELIALERLRKCPLLTITYEELVSQWEESIRKILVFLGVAHSSLAPTTLRQGASPHRSVANYSEIVETFDGTRWSLAVEGYAKTEATSRL